MRRPLGLGPIHVTSIGPGAHLVVRQAAGLGAGFFMVVVMGLMSVGLLLEQGTTVDSGNGFLHRWFFGVLVVPIAWGVDRFFLRPCVRLDEHGVVFHNPVHTVVAPWSTVRGACFDGRLRIELTDGESAQSVLFGPMLSSPLTSRDRVEQVVALLEGEAVRRGGRPSGGLGEDLFGAASAAPVVAGGPAVLRRLNLGWVHLAVYLGVWTLACALAAAVG